MSSMFAKLFGSSKKDPAPAKPATRSPHQGPTPPGAGGNQSNTSRTIQRMGDTIDTMEQRERMLIMKIDQEVGRAKEAMAKKNKNLALLCMKRKKLYEDNLGKLMAQRANMETIKITMEDTAMNAEVLRAQREAAGELTRINQGMDADRVEEDLDKMREAMDDQQRIAELLGQPIGNDMVDEDDLMGELEDMMVEEKQEKAKAQKATKPKVADEPLDMPSVPTGKLAQPAKKQPVVEEDEDEAAMRRLEEELNA
jgi:charged multivesicular body protein 4